MRTLPAGMATELAKQGRAIHRVHLFDVQRADGTQYFWSDFEGQFLSRLTGAQQLYKPWIAQPPTIKMTRSVAADGGDFRVQNLSGNTIDREVAALFKAGEFEGAYFVYRPWFVPLDAAPFELHGFMSQASVEPETVDIRVRQLFQPTEVSVFDQRQTRDCHWRFNSAQCGYRVGQVMVPSTTANIFSASTIGNSGLSLVPNLFKDEVVIIYSGTGASQFRPILSHTATTFTLKSNWTTTPDATSKFVVTGAGAWKFGPTAGVSSATANTITNTGASRTTNQDVDASICIYAGTGAGQNRAIIANDTATTWTVSPPWTVIPDGTSVFVVAYRDCAKDLGSCTTRGVTERFPGIIFLQPQITAVNGPTGVGTGGGGGSGGGSSADPTGSGGPPGAHGRLGTE